MKNRHLQSRLSNGILTVMMMSNFPVFAETTLCTEITSVPTTISSQGVYCLKGNLGTGITSGNAITITANNVILDLNGWKLGGQAAGLGSEADGIQSSATNIVIKNGVIRGFYRGIVLSGRGATIQGVTLDQNLSDGIIVEGEGSKIVGNKVVDTGNSTKNSSNWPATGITVDGSQSLVKNNLISGLTATGNSDEIAVLVQSGVYSTILSNTISDFTRPAGAGFSWGIYVDDVPSVAIVSNTLHNFDTCVQYGNSAIGGIYVRNTALSCSTAYSDGAGAATAGPGNSP